MTARLLLIFAHPYPERSRANHTLLNQVRDLEGLEVRSLYDLYPSFDIDVAEEQAALLRADVVIWQHPVYWYSVPGLLKHWFDKVLVRGFAYGAGGTSLVGKPCLWVPTAGGRRTPTDVTECTLDHSTISNRSSSRQRVFVECNGRLRWSCTALIK